MQPVDSVGDAGDSRPPVCVYRHWHRRQCCVRRRPATAGGHPVTAGRGQEFDGVRVPALQSLSTSRPVALTRRPPWDVVVAVAVLGTPAVLEKQVVVAATLQQATLHPTLHPAEKKKWHNCRQTEHEGLMMRPATPVAAATQQSMRHTKELEPVQAEWRCSRRVPLSIAKSAPRTTTAGLPVAPQ